MSVIFQQILEAKDAAEKRCEEQREENRHLREQRDALLAACKSLFDHLDGCSHGYSDELWDQAEAAIALTIAPQHPGKECEAQQ